LSLCPSGCMDQRPERAVVGYDSLFGGADFFATEAHSGCASGPLPLSRSRRRGRVWIWRLWHVRDLPLYIVYTYIYTLLLYYLQVLLATCRKFRVAVRMYKSPSQVACIHCFSFKMSLGLPSTSTLLCIHVPATLPTHNNNM